MSDAWSVIVQIGDLSEPDLWRAIESLVAAYRGHRVSDASAGALWLEIQVPDRESAENLVSQVKGRVPGVDSYAKPPTELP